MLPGDVERVQESFNSILRRKGTAGAQLYEKLFELDPSLKPMFTGDMGRQGEKLIDSIAIAVRQLDQPYALRDGFRRMGERHRNYGVRDKDYKTMSAALLWMLEQSLGDDFTPEIRASWIAMYNFVAAMMTEDAA